MINGQLLCQRDNVSEVKKYYTRTFYMINGLFQSGHLSEVKKDHIRLFDMINGCLNIQSDNLRHVKIDHTRTFVCALWTSSFSAK